MVVGGQAGGGFVEQQQPGAAGQGHAEFEEAALPVGEGPGEPVGAAGETEVGQQRPGAGGQAPVAGRRPFGAPACVAPAGQDQVVDCRRGVEQLRGLEGAADAPPGAAGRIELGDVVAVELDSPGGGWADGAGDQPEQGCLAGAVGADDGVPATLGHLQVDPVQGGQFAVGVGEVGDRQQGGHGASRRGSRTRCSAGATVRA